MAQCFDKNMIDKDEYPQTAELEARCISMLSHLWNAPDRRKATGCSTTGSSEAAMLGGLAFKRKWQHRRKKEGKPHDKPNMVMGINVQVCWDKFCNYWDVEMRQVPMEGDSYHLSPEEAVKLCDENTIGVIVIMGSTFDGSYEPSRRCLRRSTTSSRAPVSTSRSMSTAPPAASSRRSSIPTSPGTSGSRVRSINASGHKYGLVYPGVGWAIWRDAEALPEDLIFWVNYLGDDMPTFALNFSRPGRRSWPSTTTSCGSGSRLPARAALRARRRDDTAGADRGAGAVRAPDARRRAAGVRLQGEGRRQELHRLRRLNGAAERGWQVPAYTFPKNGRTWPRYASWCAAASPPTSPTCCWTT